MTEATIASAAPFPAAPPPAAWTPAPAMVAPGKGPSTGLALIAGIVMVVGGILFGLAGLAVAAVGPALIKSFGDLGTIRGLSGVDVASGIMTFVGLLILFYSLVYLIGGIGVIRSRDWGRVLGLIVGILSGLLWLGSVTTPDAAGARSSMMGSLVMFAIHAYIVVVLLFFWRSKPAGA